MPDEVLHNDPDREIDAQIMRLVEQYASCDRRSAEINDERATIRSNAEKLGFTSQEFQDGVRRVKKMSKTERDLHERNVSRIVNIAETKQAELWPKETERQEKRAAKRAEAEAENAGEGRTTEELDAATNENPRSDPAAGGAGAQVADTRAPMQPDGTAWPDDAEIAARNAEEQAAGDEALKAAAPATEAAKAGKKSQSAIAAEKVASAMSPSGKAH